jgi:hypothetical protein
MKKTCFNCGASMMDHRHSLSKSLLRGLFKFWGASLGTPMNLKEAGLTRNQWDNFQKLRYFGLVRQFEGKKNGVWQVTGSGERFLFGERTSRKTAVTYRGEWISWEGPWISFSEVTGYYHTREEYAANATPHTEGEGND